MIRESAEMLKEIKYTPCLRSPGRRGRKPSGPKFSYTREMKILGKGLNIKNIGTFQRDAEGVALALSDLKAVNLMGSSVCKTTLKIFLNRPQSEGGEETRESVSHKE